MRLVFPHQRRLITPIRTPSILQPNLGHLRGISGSSKKNQASIAGIPISVENIPPMSLIQESPLIQQDQTPSMDFTSLPTKRTRAVKFGPKNKKPSKRRLRHRNPALDQLFSVKGLEVPKEEELPVGDLAVPLTEEQQQELSRNGKVFLKLDHKPYVEPGKEFDQIYLHQRQKEIETDMTKIARDKYQKLRAEMDRLGKGACLRPAEKVLLDWYEGLKEEIAKKQKQVSLDDEEEESNPYSPKQWIPDAMGLAPFLLSLKEDKLAVITLHTVMSMILMTKRGISYARVIMQVGKTVQAEVNLKELKDIKQHRWLKKQGKLHNVRAINRQAEYILDYGTWPANSVAQLGSILVDSLLEVCILRDGETNVPYMENNSPVMGVSHQNTIDTPWGRRATRGYLVASTKMFEIIDEDFDKFFEAIKPPYYPMLSMPEPWRNISQRVYQVKKSTVMRTKGVRDHLVTLEKGNMKNVYQALNCLNSTAWRINKKLYGVVARVWDDGGNLADLPARKDIPVSEEPPKTDPQKRYEWLRAMRKIIRHNQDLHSLRSDTVLKLSVAKDLLDVRFWFPHNMDFRGRTYPIPPNLNHLGSDMCRAMLVFDKEKKIGKRGVEWMFVHMANLYGKDKISLEERKKFTESQIENIFDSADNPLGGKRWWASAENPWQCLGACFELTNMLRSPNPEEYVTGLPVHQDGTCNGLQHYAALGGDIYGAKEVNLLPSDRPQDVYNGVAQLVRKRIEADAAEGDRLAQMLLGKIDRKIVKQVVMTSVYGVTFTGARRQIENAMKDKNNLDIADQDIWQASYYITKHVFASLGEIFNGARAIMSWLGKSAREIAKKGEQVSWVTPLGMRVVQPYRKETDSKYFVRTLVQTVCLVQDEDRDQLPPNVGKNKNAFPPNYIHSLDSSHMMQTAIRMQERDLTFASVHDSYWTHASTVDEMSEILRDEFVRLHSRPLLQELLDCFNESYPGTYFDPVPERGKLDVTQVRKSRYFFN